MTSVDRRWNLNIHYHRVALAAVPAGATQVLDVGSGDGVLAFDLADRGLTLTGIDLDVESVERAVKDPRCSSRCCFLVADLFSHEFDPASFDMVVSSATLHHVDAEDGLRAMKAMVKPGGVLAIVGFARPSGVRDRWLMLVGAAFKRIQVARGRYWEHESPVSWPPPATTSHMAELVESVLPGATFRRAMSNRYSVVWHAPG